MHVWACLVNVSFWCSWEAAMTITWIEREAHVVWLHCTAAFFRFCSFATHIVAMSSCDFPRRSLIASRCCICPSQRWATQSTKFVWVITVWLSMRIYFLAVVRLASWCHIRICPSGKKVKSSHFPATCSLVKTFNIWMIIAYLTTAAMTRAWWVRATTSMPTTIFLFFSIYVLFRLLRPKRVQSANSRRVFHLLRIESPLSQPISAIWSRHKHAADVLLPVSFPLCLLTFPFDELVQDFWLIKKVFVLQLLEGFRQLSLVFPEIGRFAIIQRQKFLVL